MAEYVRKTMKHTPETVNISELEELLEKAVEAERSAEFQLCEKYCAEILLRLSVLKSADSTTAHISSKTNYMLGVVHIKQGDYQRSLERYLKAHEIAQEHSHIALMGRIQRAIATLCADQGNTQEALAHAHLALKLLDGTEYKKEAGHTLNAIARIYYGISEFTKSLEYSGRALEIFEQNGFEEDRARLLGNLGAIDFAKGDYTEALNKFNESLRYFENKNMPYEVARLYDSIAGVYEVQSKLVESIEYLEKSISIRQRIGDLSGLARNLGNLGIVYYSMSEYTKSLEYHTRSLEKCKELSLQHDVIRELGNIGNVYYSLDEYDRALEIYLDALAETEKTNNQREIARLHSNIGQAYKALNNYDLALEYTFRSLEIDRKLDTKSNAARSCSILGVLYHNLGNFEVALQYMLEALTIYEKIGMARGIADICADIADLLQNTNYPNHNLSEAEEYLKKAININTELSLVHSLSKNMLQMATMCKKQERWEESAHCFEKHIELYKQVQSEDTRNAALKFSQSRDIALMSREREILSAKNSELQEANSFKTKLMAMAAHDLKNPTSNIKLITTMLLDMFDTSSEEHDLVLMVQESAEHMNNMITSLLESTAAQTGAMQLNKKRWNIKTLVEKSQELFLLSARKKRQEIVSDLSDCYSMVDEERFMQVVDNIIGNAIKYSYENTTITIALKQIGQSVLLSISDQGQGLTSEDMKNLFQQFKRLSAVPTGDEHSTGLGLHIVKQIVDLHDGDIWAESEGHDMGTTFHVELPIAE